MKNEINKALHDLRELNDSISQLAELINSDKNFIPYRNLLNTLNHFVKDDTLNNTLVEIDLIRIDNNDSQ